MLDQLADGPERLLDSRGLGRQPEEPRQALTHERSLRFRWEELCELAASVFLGVVLTDPRRVAEDADHRPECDSLPVGKATAP